MITAFEWYENRTYGTVQVQQHGMHVMHNTCTVDKPKPPYRVHWHAGKNSFYVVDRRGVTVATVQLAISGARSSERRAERREDAEIAIGMAELKYGGGG